MCRFAALEDRGHYSGRPETNERVSTGCASFVIAMHTRRIANKHVATCVVSSLGARDTALVFVCVCSV